MKKKNYILVILSALLLISLFSCGSDVKEAKLEGHPEDSFYQLLDSAAAAMKKENEKYGEKTEYVINIEDGWRASDQLNENKLNGDEHAVTFSLEITLVGEKNTIKFFMIHDVSDQTLRCRGVYMDENGDYAMEGSKDDALELINEMLSFAK